MSDLRRIMNEFFSFFVQWFIIEWAFVLGLILLALFIKAQPAFERDFSLNDPRIQHPYVPEQISSYAIGMITTMVPAVLVILIGGCRSSAHEIHHGLLAAAAGRALSLLITEALKNSVGQLRPDFLARCQWDPIGRTCTGEILDGRKSFPSGSSSTAFVGMTFSTLFLASKTAGLCFSISSPVSFLRSPLIRLCLVLSPFAFSTWVAITSIEDYRHDTPDVVVGGIIGIFSATTCYLLYWPNPFSVDSFPEEKTSSPRLGLPGVIFPRDFLSGLFRNEHGSSPTLGTRPG